MKLEIKKYYWLIGGVILLLLYGFFYFWVYNIGNKSGECFECMIYILVLGIPCWLIGTILPGAKNIIICNLYNSIGWFGIGAGIGYLIQKIKN